MNIFNLFNRKKTIVINLDSNVRLTVVPTTGGVNATLEERGEYFDRSERAFFATLSDLVRSLRLTDDALIRKLSKAF
jgi:hypothetical protein